MHPIAFRKAMIQAYIAGAELMAERDIDVPNKKEASDWFDNEYGLTIIDKPCDCCEELDDDGDS